MFRHFNEELFAGELPEPLLNLSRGHQKAVAFFAPKRWESKETTTHEISLNPRHLADGSAIDTAQSLVHEMVHLWQEVHGTPPRRGYHDREWSAKMIAVGLQPINAATGQPAMSAHGMSDVVIEGGAFEKAFNHLPPHALLPWACLEARRQGPSKPAGDAPTPSPETETDVPKPRNKQKYTCPDCGANAWGKPAMRLGCLDHDEPVLLVAV